MSKPTLVNIQPDEQTLMRMTESMCLAILANPNINPLGINPDALAEKSVKISQALINKVFDNDDFKSGILDEFNRQQIDHN
ncbi:MAG: hypothetical protein AAF298_00245 [Cyanobacteria bacterium P01_A01_bin.40]